MHKLTCSCTMSWCKIILQAHLPPHVHKALGCSQRMHALASDDQMELTQPKQHEFFMTLTASICLYLPVIVRTSKGYTCHMPHDTCHLLQLTSECNTLTYEHSCEKFMQLVCVWIKTCCHFAKHSLVYSSAEPE